MSRSVDESDRGPSPDTTLRLHAEGGHEGDPKTGVRLFARVKSCSDLVSESHHIECGHHRCCSNNDAASNEITKETRGSTVGRCPACCPDAVTPPGSDQPLDRNPARGVDDTHTHPAELFHSREKFGTWARFTRSDGGLCSCGSTELFSVVDSAECAPAISDYKHNKTLRHSRQVSVDGVIKKCRIYSLSLIDVGEHCRYIRKTKDRTADSTEQQSHSLQEVIDTETIYHGSSNDLKLQPNLDFSLPIQHNIFKPPHLVRYSLKHLVISLLRKSHGLPEGTLKLARNSIFQTFTSNENTKCRAFHSDYSKLSAKPEIYRQGKTFDFKLAPNRDKGILTHPRSNEHYLAKRIKAEVTKPGQRAASSTHSLPDFLTSNKYLSRNLPSMDGLKDKEFLIRPSGGVSEEIFNELSPLKSLLIRTKSKSTSLYDALNGSRKRSDVKRNEDPTGENVPEPGEKHEVDTITPMSADIPLSHRLLNVALAYLWVGPLVTVYWCNTWHIPEHYLFPPDPVTSSWISGAVGYTIYFLATFFQDALAAFADSQRECGWLARWSVQWSVMQLFSYVMCWACILQWRCVWVLMDEYTGVQLLNAALTCAGASALMLLMRVHRTTASAPSTVRMDLPVEGHFYMNTFFEIKTGHWLSRAADSMFTTIVVDTVGITFWRGFWEVLDTALVPEDKAMSGVWTLVISYSLAFLLVITQDLVKRAGVRLEDRHWIVSLVVEDFVTLTHTVVTICHWRGFWVLMDAYLPFKPLSHWVCHLVSFCLLAIGLTATSIPVLGCARDGRLQKGEGIVFDNYYFTHLYRLWPLNTTKAKIRMTEEKLNADVMCTAVMTKHDVISAAIMSTDDVMSTAVIGRRADDT